MGAQTRWAIKVLAIVYLIATVLGCLALTFDGAGTAHRLMDAKILPIPFYPNWINLTGWKLMGAVGALMFAGRWVVQFWYARKAGRAVTPLVFWVMSLIGSNMQLIYFIWSPKQDMVGVIANFLPTFVAVYNLFLELKNRSQDEAKDTARVAEKAVAKKKEIPPEVMPEYAEPAAGE